MNEERAREIAIRIRDEFEDLLDEKNITVPSADREGVPGEARLYGEENSRLEEAIVRVLINDAVEITSEGDVDDASHPVRELAIRFCDEFEELLDKKGIMIPSSDGDGDPDEGCLFGAEYYALEDAVVGILMEELGAATTPEQAGGDQRRGAGGGGDDAESDGGSARGSRSGRARQNAWTAGASATGTKAWSYHTVEVTEMADREHTITLTLCEGDLEMSMGRKPRDDDEFEEWVRLCEKGLLNGHIDWDILYACAKEAMPVDADQWVLGAPADRRRKPKTKPSEETP